MPVPAVPAGVAVLQFGKRKAIQWGSKQLTRFELGRRLTEKAIDRGHGEDSLENRRRYEQWLAHEREATMNAVGTLEGWNPPMWNSDP